MNVDKVLIKDIEIPFKKGLLRMVDYRREKSIEVELLVHPTIVNYVDTKNLFKEKVTIVLKDRTEINGTFRIHIGKSSILLTGDVKDAKGAEYLAELPDEKDKGFYLIFQPGDGVSINNELKTKQKLMLSTILIALKENVIEDEENKTFVTTLIKKLDDGKKLNTFEQFIKEEIGYMIDEIMR